jgi:hypothetical protein
MEPIHDVLEIPSQRLPPDPWQQVAPGVWEVVVYLEPEWWLERGGKAENYEPEQLVRELPVNWTASATVWWDRDRWRIGVTTPTECYDNLSDVVTHTVEFPHPSHALACLVAKDTLDRLYVEEVRAYRKSLNSHGSFQPNHRVDL